jgi:hypothetical protein
MGLLYEKLSAGTACQSAVSALGAAAWNIPYYEEDTLPLWGKFLIRT